MLQLGLYDFLRHIKRNVFVAVFLAVMCLLITSLYSVFYYEYGKFKPFKKLEKTAGNGFFLADTVLSDDPLNGFTNNFVNNENINKIYQVHKGNNLKIEGRTCSVYVYGEWTWKNWQARLKNGEWFDDYDKEDELIQVVIGVNTQGYEPGDIIECTVDGKNCKCIVKGILQDNTEIMFSPSGYYIGDMNYESCYVLPQNSRTFVLMQEEAADACGIASDEVVSNWAILEYRDDVSDEVVHEINSLAETLSIGAGVVYRAFLEDSTIIVYEKMLAYVPMMVSAFVLSIIAVITVAFINVEKGAKYYSIYYLTGGSKRECFLIASGNVAGTILISVILYITGNEFLEWFTRQRNIVYSTIGAARVMAAGLYAVFTVFLVVCMFFAMKQNSPLDMLRKHRQH